MKRRKTNSCARNVLACDIIRESILVWPGIGVYTVMELLWLAGKLPCPIPNGLA
jgi:hypothetical protein